MARRRSKTSRAVDRALSTMVDDRRLAEIVETRVSKDRERKIASRATIKGGVIGAGVGAAAALIIKRLIGKGQ